MKYKCPRYDEKFCGTGCPHGGEHDRRDNCHKQCDRRAFHGETGIVCVAVEDNPDAAVVSRFNELVNEGKVEFRAGEMDCWKSTGWIYRLRPTPRYRPFTAVEAAGQLGRVVRLREGLPSLCEWNDWSITYDKSWGYSITVGSSALSPNDAKDKLFFTDTGEPFGVKE